MSKQPRVDLLLRRMLRITVIGFMVSILFFILADIYVFPFEITKIFSQSIGIFFLGVWISACMRLFLYGYRGWVDRSVTIFSSEPEPLRYTGIWARVWSALIMLFSFTVLFVFIFSIFSLRIS